MAPLKPKPRCSGMWTEARYTSFIKSALRGSSRKWKPISDCLREARVSRGIYECAGCKKHVPKTSIHNGKKVNNAHVDHIDPIVDPATGFTTWDDFIARLFCEKEALQLLCHECHETKTNEEKAVAAERRRIEKSQS